MEEKENRLGTQPIGKLLVQMSLPAITAQVINALYNIVDRIYIGHLPEVGSLALASLGVAFPLIMIISAFAALIGMGVRRVPLSHWAQEKRRRPKRSSATASQLW